MSDLDRYLDDFGRTLERATATPPKPASRRLGRRLLLPAAGLAVAVACALVAVLALPGAQDRFDLIAEARAALTPDGEILHTVVVQRHTTFRPDGRARPANPNADFRQERWSATDPTRWRAVSGSDRVQLEQSYDGKARRVYDRRHNRLLIMRGRIEPPKVRQVVPDTDLGADPIATLQGLLARGDLRDSGTRRIAGREVRALTAVTRIALDRNELVVRSAYLVDPTTFAPIAIELRYESAGKRSKLDVRFETFERLPLTPETAKLLTIDPKPNPKIIVGRRR